jgi:hypothetical protein
MKILESIWKDIQQGENIDLYLTVSVALVLTLLNLCGIAPQSAIAPMTLAVLGLLAIASLVNRRKVEEMLKVIQAKEQTLLNEFPSDFQSRMEKSNELWLFGVNLGRTTVSNYTLFEDKIKRGNTIKVLLVSPQGQALPLASKRRREPNYLKQNLALIEATLTSFSDLKKIAPDKVEIRTIDYPLSSGFVAVDPDTASGTLYVSYYSFKTAGSSIPKMVFQPKDGYWYEHFREEMNNLWNDAMPWQP